MERNSSSLKFKRPCFGLCTCHLSHVVQTPKMNRFVSLWFRKFSCGFVLVGLYEIPPSPLPRGGGGVYPGETSPKYRDMQLYIKRTGTCLIWVIFCAGKSFPFYLNSREFVLYTSFVMVEGKNSWNLDCLQKNMGLYSFDEDDHHENRLKIAPQR